MGRQNRYVVEIDWTKVPKEYDVFDRETGKLVHRGLATRTKSQVIADELNLIHRCPSGGAMDPNDEGPIPREIRALRARVAELEADAKRREDLIQDNRERIQELKSRVAELEDAIRHLLDHASDEGWRDAAIHAGALIPAKR